MANILLKDVSKQYGAVKVIHDLDLEIEDGAFVVLVGPSGCGKSTLLRMIAGLEDVSKGDIIIDGKIINEVPPKARDLSMVFQNYALYPHMRVRDNIGFSLRISRVARTEINRRVSEVAEMLEMSDLLDRRPSELSGGQRQRVAMGRAIIRNPRAFLLDEPLSNLDAELRVKMRSELVSLHQRLGTTMVYVTHDQVEAMTMADQIVVMRDGRIEQFGAPLELYARPDNIFVAGFLGAPPMNFFACEATSNKSGSISVKLRGGGSKISISKRGESPLDNAACTLGVRPEHLTIDSKGRLKVTVEASEVLGSETIIHAKNASGDAVTISHRGISRLKFGEEIRLKIQDKFVHLFDSEGKALLSERTWEADYLSGSGS